MAEVDRTKKVKKEEGAALKPCRTGGCAVKGWEQRKATAALAEVEVLFGPVKKAAKRRSMRDGAEMLKRASDQALVEITGAVVERLQDGARKGDIVCVKTLMSFSERKKPREKRKRRRGPSLAELWAREPEWVDPEDEDEGNGLMMGELK